MDADFENLELYRELRREDALKEKRKQERKEKREKKRKTLNERGALNSVTTLFHAEEKEIKHYYKKKLTDQVMEERGKITIVDEIHIDLFCIAMVRVYRKSRLESQYGRFADRLASQDPIAQANNCLKELKLNSEKNKAEVSETELLNRLINGNETKTHEEWVKEKKDIPAFKRRNHKELDMD